ARRTRSLADRQRRSPVRRCARTSVCSAGPRRPPASGGRRHDDQGAGGYRAVPVRGILSRSASLSREESRMTYSIPRAIAFMVVGPLAAAGCSQPRAVSGTGDLPTVAVARVLTGDVAQVLSIAAEFRPFQEIDVHAKVAGYLKSINVDVGDRVRAGQLLAVLEVPELQ